MRCLAFLLRLILGQHAIASLVIQMPTCPRRGSFSMKRAAAGFCAILALGACAAMARAEPAANVSVMTAKAGTEIPSDFAGLSFETSMVLPDENGDYYFTPTNKPLIAMLKMLDVKNF